MAVSTNFRWIAVGSLLVRQHANAPVGAGEFTLDEIISYCQARIDANRMHRIFASEAKIMWVSDIQEDNDYYTLLSHVGDKNVAGMSLVDFQTMAARDVEKAEEEGGLYSSHIVIRKQADQDSRHPILIEKVPGVYLSSFKDYLAWVCNHADYMKVADDDDGTPRSYRAVFEVDGYQSRTVSEAIAGGKLKDVEFVSIEADNVDGLDEEPLIEEVVHEAKWTINKKIPEDRIDEFFGWLRGKKPTDDARMFVRIQTETGQIKTTEIDPSNDQMLEAAFVQNEVISDFNEPLSARHEGIRADVVAKITAKAP